jgi:hypothetical protein
MINFEEKYNQLIQRCNSSFLENIFEKNELKIIYYKNFYKFKNSESQFGYPINNKTDSECFRITGFNIFMRMQGKIWNEIDTLLDIEEITVLVKRIKDNKCLSNKDTIKYNKYLLLQTSIEMTSEEILNKMFKDETVAIQRQELLNVRLKEYSVKSDDGIYADQILLAKSRDDYLKLLFIENLFEEYKELATHIFKDYGLFQPDYVEDSSLTITSRFLTVFELFESSEDPFEMVSGLLMILKNKIFKELEIVKKIKNIENDSDKIDYIDEIDIFMTSNIDLSNINSFISEINKLEVIMNKINDISYDKIPVVPETFTLESCKLDKLKKFNQRFLNRVFVLEEGEGSRALTFLNVYIESVFGEDFLKQIIINESKYDKNDNLVNTYNLDIISNDYLIMNYGGNQNMIPNTKDIFDRIKIITVNNPTFGSKYYKLVGVAYSCNYKHSVTSVCYGNGCLSSPVKHIQINEENIIDPFNLDNPLKQSKHCSNDKYTIELLLYEPIETVSRLQDQLKEFKEMFNNIEPVFVQGGGYYKKYLKYKMKYLSLKKINKN